VCVCVSVFVCLCFGLCVIAVFAHWSASTRFLLDVRACVYVCVCVCVCVCVRVCVY